jgi:hypothetical protein
MLVVALFRLLPSCNPHARRALENMLSEVAGMGLVLATLIVLVITSERPNMIEPDYPFIG